MSWVKLTPLGGRVRNVYGTVIGSARSLIDYHENDTTINREAALLQVDDYDNSSGYTITLNASNDSDDLAPTEGLEFNAATNNATTASNIASYINGQSNWYASAVAGHAWNPYVYIVYTNGYIDGASSDDTTACSFTTVNATNGTIARLGTDNTGSTGKKQPLFTDSDGFFSGFLDNKGDVDFNLNKSGVTFNNTRYEEITLAGGHNPWTEDQNANGNLITQYIGMGERKRPPCGVI